MNRVRVKICGLTNFEDALAAVEAGADALGFNFYPGSKRFVQPQKIAPWLLQLPPFVSRVAVMVNPTLDEARAAAKVAGIDALQLHGDESLDFCAALVRDGAVEIIKALPLRSVGDFEKISEYEKTGVSAVLVDADAPGEFGGTGRVIDWRLAAELAAGRLRIPLILSGGLHSENVAEAVETVRPYAVDVASGVEAETPRRKDAVRMNAFLAAVGLGFQNLRLGKSTE